MEPSKGRSAVPDTACGQSKALQHATVMLEWAALKKGKSEPLVRNRGGSVLKVPQKEEVMVSSWEQETTN